MKLRLISSVVGLIVFFGIFMFSDTWIINVAVAICSIICLYEALVATKYLESRVLMAVSFTVGAFVPFVPRFSANMLQISIYVLALVIFITFILNYNQFSFEHVAVVFLLSVIIPYFLSNIINVRRMDFGEFYFIFVFMCAWISDSGAMICGRLFGKHKLTPILSPKKTVEGAIGAVICTVIGGFIFALIVDKIFGLQVNYILCLVFALVGSLAAQVGDLSMSTLKRAFNVKDFGSIMPGHGGLLDRFDSVLFVAPLINVLLHFRVLILP